MFELVSDGPSFSDFFVNCVFKPMSLIVATFLKEDGVKEIQEVILYWPLTGLQQKNGFSVQ